VRGASTYSVYGWTRLFLQGFFLDRTYEYSLTIHKSNEYQMHTEMSVFQQMLARTNQQLVEFAAWDFAAHKLIERNSPIFFECPIVDAMHFADACLVYTRWN